MPSFFWKVNTISRCGSLYRSEKSSEGLCGIYHSYILLICGNPGITQNALSKLLYKHKSSVARHMAFLEAGGYITREGGSRDKREVLIYPTEKMRASLPEVKAITEEWTALLSAGIPEEKLAVFSEVLDRMLSRAEETARHLEVEK